MRFVPVPYAALDEFDVGEWHAVVDVYRRAHAREWTPFEITERSLCTRWNLSGRRVWSLLDQMAGLGLLSIERGGNRKATRITVFCPTGETAESDDQKVKHSRQRSRQRFGQQNEQDSTKDIDDSDAQDEAQTEAQNVETLTRVEIETGDREEEPASPSAPLVLAPKAAEPKPAKAKRVKSPKTPDTAWTRQMTDRWTVAFGPGYAFDWFKDRQSLARAAGAVGVELNQPLPEAALDHLQRAMAVYIAAARRDDPACWPKGTPTIGGFVVRLSEWVMKAAKPAEPVRPPHDGLALPPARRPIVEDRLRPLLANGGTVESVRAQVAASTRLNADERAYALHFLEQHALKAKGVPR